MVPIGKVIRRYRQDHEWTLDDLAEKTGIAISTLSKAENGQRAPTSRTLHILAKTFDTDVSTLYALAAELEQKADHVSQQDEAKEVTLGEPVGPITREQAIATLYGISKMAGDVAEYLDRIWPPDVTVTIERVWPGRPRQPTMGRPKTPDRPHPPKRPRR